jgi:thymidine phosphorylase
MTMDVHSIPIVRAGIDTYRQPVVYMREDCHLCRAEGFSAQTRVEVTLGSRSLVAILNVVTDADWLDVETAALSETAWAALAATAGDRAILSHPEPPRSTSLIRAKVYGETLSEVDFRAIMDETVGLRLSDLDLAAFVTASAGDRLTFDETAALTKAMRDAGKKLDWGGGLVLDKHCVGGLPGNRTTPVVVSIVAAAGFTIPKTSSRAITSPAGTADTMEVMTPVALDIAGMRRVVEAEGGCIVWGGGLDLSPADDLLIRIERPLDFDSDGQLVASILSKKSAAGSTHVVIDMPVGPTAKVRSAAAAAALGERLTHVSAAVGLALCVHHSDGSAPVGLGIGPALEAADCLSVLRCAADAPADLHERSLEIAGKLLDLASGGKDGLSYARRLLTSGEADRKFLAICEAQGGFREPQLAAHRSVEIALRRGRLVAIDNRRIARIAKLAGAPGRKKAGVKLLAVVGDEIEAGQPLYEIHAETPGELQWSQDYARSGTPPIYVGDAG